MATFFVLLSSKRRCRLCLDPFFSCPPTSTLFVERGPSPPPFPFIGRMGVFDSSRLNLDCKFSSSPQKIVLFNILIAFIFTLLLFKVGQRLFRMGAAFCFLFFFTKRFFNVESYRQSRHSFLSLSSLLRNKMASLPCCFSPPFAIQSLGPP